MSPDSYSFCSVCYENEIQSFNSEIFFFIITYFCICVLNLQTCQLCDVSGILFAPPNLETI